MQYVERELSGRSDVQVLHATGEVNYEYYMAEMRKVGSLDDNIMIRPYLHNMPVALAAADLAVFRAGAIGLAELTARVFLLCLYHILTLQPIIRNLTLRP